jgi:hypothetical protein
LTRSRASVRFRACHAERCIAIAQGAVLGVTGLQSALWQPELRKADGGGPQCPKQPTRSSSAA